MSWHKTAVSQVFQHNTFLTVDEEDEDLRELPPGAQHGTEAFRFRILVQELVSSNLINRMQVFSK